MLTAKYIPQICHLVAYCIWESHTTLFLAVSSRDWITFSLCLKRICSMSSAFRLLNFCKKGSRRGQRHLLKKEQPLFSYTLTSVLSPQRESKPPRSLLPAAREKNLELYSLFTSVLQEKSFGNHEKSEVSTQQLKKHLSRLTEIQILYCGRDSE